MPSAVHLTDKRGTAHNNAQASAEMYQEFVDATDGGYQY
jgi:hypothetical protein